MLLLVGSFVCNDTLADKLLPAYLRVSLKPINTVLDNLNLAEKFGLIPSVTHWIEARSLRSNFYTNV
jgi:hypothetical protein